jgi:dTDP-4-amino-4,6-dideoxygalactose transaminase
MTLPVSGKPRGDWLWRQMGGRADPAAAAVVAGDASYWLCRSGRRALHEALRRQPARSGRRLLMPAFMCRGVVPAAEAAGFEVALYDIDDRFRPVAGSLDVRAGDAVLVAHFFGLAQSLTVLHESVCGRGAILIEDCAHLLKPGHDGSSIGHFGEWSIFSFRKQLPVTCGGMLIGPGVTGKGTDTRVSRRLTPRHALLMAERVGPTMFGRYYCGLVEWIREKLDPVRGAGAWSSDDDDAIGAMTLRALQYLDIETIAAKRCANYRALAAALGPIYGAHMPYAELPHGSVPMALPVAVDRPAEVAASMWAAGIGAFLWPGFEVIGGVDWSRFPGTRTSLDRLVCLPIHQDLDEADLDRVHVGFAQALRTVSRR